MIISLKWLKKYIDLENISTEEIVEKLTTSGSEVEEVIDRVAEFENIIVGKIEGVEKHPNADRLSVCKVSDGTEVYTVVCGAPNVAAGQIVPFAKIGAIIPEGKFEIKKAKIRGEHSFGMICAEDELGLGDDHSGIMVLDNKLNIGDSFARAMNLDDVIFDIAITPNRADSLSHIGIARDLAAIFNKKINYPEVTSKFKVVEKNDFAEVIIENSSGCPRYSAVVVEGVTPQESPEWLKEKLKSIGLRPINNIVDVTNFVLYEMGQPLHAFDLNLIFKNKIVIKNNNIESKFTTLDSKERSMLPSDLMICDGEKPIAIAGVMGGENSEVTAETKNILIESAYFNPSSVRKTAKHLNLSTDASFRFERGTNPNTTLEAALRAAQLIQETAGGKIIEDVIDIYPKKIDPNEVSVRYSRIEKILGFTIEKQKIVEILTGLEFVIMKNTFESITVQVPTFRHDIQREIDLIEEIVRVYGFDGIPPIKRISVVLESKVDELEFEDKVKNSLTAIGFNEVISNSLLSDEKTMNYDESIKVLNPQSTEMSRLRTSLIPGMLLNISRNIKIKEEHLKFFEIGDIFKKKPQDINSFDDIIENKNLIIAICGIKNNSTWYEKESRYDYFDLAGIVNPIFRSHEIKQTFNEDGNNEFEYYSQIEIDKDIVGLGGKVNDKLLKNFEISKDVFLYEINLDELKNKSKKDKKFKPLLKYPKVYRDFGFILDKNIPYNDVVKTIKDSSSKLLKKVNLFDIFESESLGLNKKSLAFQLEYFDNDRTLREEEIDAEFWKTIEIVKTKLNAELRG